MKASISIFLLLFSLQFCLSQNTWERTYTFNQHHNYRTKANSIIQTSDGNFVVCGYGESVGGTAPDTLIVMKVNTYGDTMWVHSKCYGILGMKDIIETESGDFIIVTGDFLIKLNHNGRLIEYRQFELATHTTYHAIDQIDDNEYIISGYVYESFPPGFLSLLMKINSSLDTLWTKTLDTTGIVFPSDVHVTIDGGYIVVGGPRNNINCIFVLKFDENDDLMWDIDYTSPDANYSWYASWSVVEDQNGNFIIAGSNSDGSDGEGLLFKLDNLGQLVWEKYFPQDIASQLNSVSVTNDGNYLVSGFGTNPDSYYNRILMLLCQDGDTIWTRSFDYSYSYGYDAITTSDNGIAMAGIKGWDMYLAKLNENGLVAQKEIVIYDIQGKAYPNPLFKGQYLTVDLSSSSIEKVLSYELLTSDGKSILSGKCGEHKTNGSLLIPCFNLPSGIYILKLTSSSSYLTHKIVVN